MAIENFQAEISATIRDFQRAMREVDRQIRDTAMGADANIGADVSEFRTSMAAVNATLANLSREHDVNIDADTTGFTSGITRVRTAIMAFSRTRIVIPIRTAWSNYQQVMGMMASFHRNMSEIMGMTAGGIKISLSPAIVPILASVVGLLGQLGPMLGTIGGSTFALGTAFATAGIGAAGFGAVAVSNLKDVFSASSDLKDLQEKLDDATTLKERKKIMKEMSAIQGSMNKEQTKALKSMDKLKDTWSKITDGLETKTIQIFTKALDVFGSVLKTLSPMFSGVTVSVDRLMDTLGRTIKSDSMKAFFDYLNKSAGPMLETISKSFGNFMKGFLSMMVAFGPLAAETSNGFLKMSEGFAKWADGLGESKKFQSFVDYVNENMPKIKSIFGDAISGVINTFAAFAPSSADMMTSLQDMMARFKEWSTTLSENQGFQNFINYVKENGPRVVELIGNITTFIVELGIAFAPMGALMLDLINRFLEWSSAMIESYPWIGKIMAAVVVFGGAMLAAMPHVVGLITVIQALQAPIIASTAKMVANAAVWVAKWVWMAAQSTLHATKVAAAWALATGRAMVTAIASMIASAVTFVARWTLIGAQAMIHAAKVAAAWTLSTGAALVKSLALMVATSATFVAKWLWMGVQSLLHAAKMASAWFIALGPVGWVTAAIIGLVVLVIANWEKISTKTKEIWTNISNAVKEAWVKVKEKTAEALIEVVKIIAKMPGKVTEFAKEMLTAGGDLIMGLIKGITGMADKALDAITGVVDSVVNKAKSLLKIKSPSRVFLGIGEFVVSGLAGGITSTQQMAMNAIKKVTSNVIAQANKVLVNGTKQTNAEIQTLEKNSANEIKKIESNKARDITTIHKNAKAQKRKLTVMELARIEKLEESSADKIAKINKKLAADSIKLQEESGKKKIEALNAFIEQKKQAEQLSLVDEAKIWESSTKMFADGTQAKLDAQRNYSKAVAAVNQEIISINQEYSDKMMQINNDLKSQEEELTKAYETSLTDRTNSLRSFVGIFDEVDVAIKDSGSKLLSNLQGQVDAFKTWQQQIGILSSRAINEGLLAELQEMGPSALPELLALNSLTDAQLSKYSDLYKEKSQLARQQAEKELIGMNNDTIMRITELRTSANAELEVLRSQWATKIQGISKATDNELKSLKTIGVNAAKGLEAGLLSMESSLVATATSIANSVAAAMRSALQIKSPSRVFKEIGAFTVEGFAVGVKDSAALAISSVMNMASAVTDAFSPQLAMPLMDLKMNPLDTSSQVESLKRQIKQELSVDMSVNHRGGAGGNGGGFNQEVHLHSPKALSPSENARALDRIGRQQAVEWGLR